MLINELKLAVRISRKRLTRPHYGSIIIYPSTPEEFKNQHPQIYEAAYETDSEDDIPFACPLDAVALAQLRDRLPARITHRATRRLPAGAATRTGAAWTASP